MIKYSEGGSTQKNDAHLIEFLAATAIIDFSHKKNERRQNEHIETSNYELGIKDLKGDTAVHFSSFYGGLNEMLYHPLTQFALMANTFKEDYDYLKNTLAATKNLNDFYSSSFIKNLESFLKGYESWLREMDLNDRPLRLFNFNCGKKPFDIVQGIVNKSHWNPFKNKDYDAVRASLNKKVTAAKKIEKDPSSMFMETFYLATEELINNKLKN